MPFTAIDPLRTMNGASAGRKLDREPVRIAVLPDVLDRAGGVDVPLDEMPAEPRIGAQRPLEIHHRPALDRAERGDARGLRRDVGMDAVADRRTTTVRQTPFDREAVAVRQLAARAVCPAEAETRLGSA